MALYSVTFSIIRDLYIPGSRKWNDNNIATLSRNHRAYDFLMLIFACS